MPKETQHIVTHTVKKSIYFTKAEVEELLKSAAIDFIGLTYGGAKYSAFAEPAPIIGGINVTIVQDISPSELTITHSPMGDIIGAKHTGSPE